MRARPLEVGGARPVIVNAASEEDIEVVTLGPPVPAPQRPFAGQVLGGLPLRHEELYPHGPRPGHGLVAVGSHVGHRTRQVAELLKLPGLTPVELEGAGRRRRGCTTRCGCAS